MTFYKPREKNRSTMYRMLRHFPSRRHRPTHPHPPPPSLTVQISQRRQYDIKGNLAVSGSINIPSPALSQVMREQLPSQEVGGGRKNSFVWKLCWSQTSFHAVWLWRQETAHFYDAKSQKLVNGRLKKKKTEGGGRRGSPVPAFLHCFTFLLSV